MLDHPKQFDDRFIARAKKSSIALSIFTMLIGAFVLTGWLFDFHELTTIYGAMAVKANTALALMLSGASLWLLNSDHERREFRIAGVIGAAIVSIIGLLTLSEHIFGWNLGIDQILFKESARALATTNPGRMGLPASTCFSLAGIALLLLHNRRAIRLPQIFSIVVSLWALLAIVGYAYNAQALYNIANYTGIALPTAVSLLAVSFGLLCARIDQGVTTMISREGAGALLARRLLFMAITVPFLLGWLRVIGERKGYYDLAFGTAILVLSIVIVFTIVIWQSAARVSHAEQRQLVAENVAREKGEGIKRLATLIELSYEPIFIWDLEHGIVEWNKGCEQLYRYNRQEALGHISHQLLNTEFPSPLPDYLEMLRREGYWSGELRHTTGEGAAVLVESRQQMIEAQGKLLVLETNRDITERQRSREELAQLLVREQLARTEAEAASRLKDEFLATISHELRTPLSAVLGWATMLRANKLDAAASARAIETIERNARAQAQLIEDLLDVSRITSGKFKLDVQPIELISVIKAAIDSVRPAADAKSIQLELRLDPAADHIHADANRLQQVIWNLLANAIKFTAQHGHVQLNLDRIDSKAQISVSDTGEGISAEFLPHVFDRFQQADGAITRRHGGLGLGLAIARHLVEMHGGSIEAASEGIGRGAIFTLRVPISLSHRSGSLSLSGTPAISERDGINDEVPNLNGLRILAIDDEADAREMLSTLLEGCGADVLTAASAKEGFEAIAGWKPDILICDIGMPEEDGYSLIRKVRALEPPAGGGIAAIALTGYVRVEERIRALEAGYQMFVPKPVAADELKSIIAELVGRTKQHE